MRLRAYVKAISEASQLPESIPELKGYFCDSYNPRRSALYHISKMAREDVDGLFDGELSEVLRLTSGDPVVKTEGPKKQNSP